MLTVSIISFFYGACHSSLCPLRTHSYTTWHLFWFDVPHDFLHFLRTLFPLDLAQVLCLRSYTSSKKVQVDLSCPTGTLGSSDSIVASLAEILSVPPLLVATSVSPSVARPRGLSAFTLTCACALWCARPGGVCVYLVARHIRCLQRLKTRGLPMPPLKTTHLKGYYFFSRTTD